MGEKKRKLCESDPPPSPSSSPSPLQSQFHPNTPQIVRYTPKYVPTRTQTNTCYRCRKQGHWPNSCPLINNSTAINDSDHYPKIWCDCGHGFCQVRIVSKKNKNNNAGRKYYACPIKRGQECGKFQWCDDKIKQRPPPLYKYPECECGAGVCRKVKETVRPYFTCPVGENHGSCGYHVWEDDLLDSMFGNIVPIDQSSQRTHVFLEGYQNEETEYDWGHGGDLLVEGSKRMRVMDDSENPSSMVVSLSKCFGCSDFEVDDYLSDLEFENSVPWEKDIEEKPFLISQLSKPSRISCQKNLFQGHSFADSTFGPCQMGWLGRLLFSYPTQSLEFPSPQPFLCCVFPSFNPIKLPKQVNIHIGPCKRNQLSYNTLSQHAQISTGCDTEVSRDLNKSPASESKPMAKAEWQRQVVLFAQQKLLTDLETLNPNKHESMRGAAEAAFDVLDKLGIDHKQFSEHVLDFIDLASSMAEMDKSMENFLTLDDYNKRFEDEKARFACIQVDCINTETSFQTSNKRMQSLIEEISRYQAMLHEKQTQLKSCELENLQIEARLRDIRRSLVEAEATLKVTAEEANMARQLNEERQAKQIEAQTTLQLAKLEMENV